MTDDSHAADEADVQPGISPPDLPQSPVPWENRREIGSTKAFWKTIAMVLASNGRLGRLIDEPLSIPDAKLFARKCVWYALAGWLAMIFLSLGAVQDAGRGIQTAGITVDKIWITAIMAAITFLLGAGWLAGINGMVKWFFCPRSLSQERQETSVAIAHYLAAPLSLMVFFLPLLSVLALENARAVATVSGIMGWGMLLLLGYWLQIIVKAARSVGQRTPAGTAATGVGLFVLWGVLGLGLILAVPAVMMWLTMWSSLSW